MKINPLWLVVVALLGLVAYDKREEIKKVVAPPPPPPPPPPAPRKKEPKVDPKLMFVLIAGFGLLGMYLGSGLTRFFIW